MGGALLWGGLAASSLVIGAALGLARPWSSRLVGAVLAFGAGALISAVSFDLAEEGLAIGGGDSVALGLGVGAVTFFVADRIVQRSSSGGGTSGEGTTLALGALLDGFPEQLVLGIGLVTAGDVSVGLLAAIFVSNLPEAVGSASEMRSGGRSASWILRMWFVVAAITTFATLAGYAIADEVSGDVQAAVNGFAAGALLVMLTDSMIPAAREKAGDTAGLVTVLGFAVAASLSTVTA